SAEGRVSGNHSSVENGRNPDSPEVHPDHSGYPLPNEGAGGFYKRIAPVGTAFLHRKSRKGMNRGSGPIGQVQRMRGQLLEHFFTFLQKSIALGRGGRCIMV